jgi:PAB-dependent poly(A)-specific ribonuclease subunit 2
MLLSGSADGYLRTHDYRANTSNSGGAEGLVRAHANGIRGLQTTGYYAFTIGLSERSVLTLALLSLLLILLQTLSAFPRSPSQSIRFTDDAEPSTHSFLFRTSFHTCTSEAAFECCCCLNSRIGQCCGRFKS